MTNTVLILGATGRFGRNCAAHFEAAGWRVRRFDRKSDDMQTAARGVDVIVNAWSLLYSDWAKNQVAVQAQVQRAALDNDALVIIPGNVYVFGAQTPAPWSHTSPKAAQNPLGRHRIAMEDSYRTAGVRTLVLRGGDYLDTEPSGNWFDKILAPALAKGRFTYPGNPNLPHAWAYLPDITKAAVQLAEKRDSLQRFEEVCFPGYTLSGTEIGAVLAEARGHDVRVVPFKWWMLRLVQPFWREVPHIFEMSYLWNTPHWLSADRFNALLPDFEHTPAKDALRRAADFVPRPKDAAPVQRAVTT